jgi:hypothetical protein
MTTAMTTSMTKAITRTMPSAALALAAVMALMSACRDASPDAGQGQARRSAPPPALDSRNQYDLARAMTEAERSRDPEQVALGYHKIRTSWTGKRYRWRVRIALPLCRRADACNAIPFQRAGRDKAVVHGWMPRLLLDDTGFAAIRRACTGKPSCDVDIEGTLSQLRLDTENPTSLEFRDVRVL